LLCRRWRFSPRPQLFSFPKVDQGKWPTSWIWFLSPFGYYRAFEQVEWMRASLIATLLSGSCSQKTSAMRCWNLRRAGEQDRVDDETVFIIERN
jgi:hypothetical protein